jgi:hypothetical protein
MDSDQRVLLFKLIEKLNSLTEPDENLEDEIQSLQMNIMLGELNDED